ncbi:monovalent cation/H+ antiporter complex subunit F [Nonomuraea sp. NPDC048826]|uniref:monovalent cation/H+ antiporter complex subunit F n=1 Tax=Nonomuraea sp. NPDC048826 TaxID=3364347 RepID=UPI0037174D3A
MTTVYLVTLVMLGVGAAAALFRLGRGPTTLDRAVSLDVITSLAMCGAGAYAAVYGDYADVPVLLVLSLLGFVGTVSLARFFPEGGQ